MQLKLALGFAFLALSLNGFAQDRGGHDGGGGQGVVCYNNQNQIESVELLDLYEGRNMEGLNYEEFEGSYPEIYEVITSLYDDRLQDSLKKASDIINPGLKFMATGMRLKPINDGNTIFVPANCQIEQLVNFQGPSRIFIVTDFWNKMTATNKAALLLHEALWTMERDRGVLYSSRARREVARKFAGFQRARFKYNPQPEDLECWIDNDHKITGHFYVSERHKNLIFSDINSGDRYGNYEADFYDYDEFKLFKSSFLPVASQSDIRHDSFNFILSVRDMNTGILSHELNFKMKRSIADGVEHLETRLDTTNLEFPGFNTKDHSIACSPYMP